MSTKKSVSAAKKVSAVKPAVSKAKAAPKAKTAPKPAPAQVAPAAPQKAVAKAEPAPKKTVAARHAKPEPAVFENPDQNFAFSFAEEMKRAQREADAAAEAAHMGVKLTRRPESRVKGKATLQFPAADLEQFKKSLLQLRATALGQSVSLRNIALEQTAEERGGEDEDGSDASLRLQNLGHADSQNRMVQKIDEALARIENGTYGVCEVCGQLIRKPRLMNLPFVHTCMECQTDMERR